MQHIGLKIINEKGLVIKRSNINFVDIMIYLFRQEDYEKRFSLLSTIDPYGLTIFNELQIKNLIQDLKTLQDISSGTLKFLIQEVIVFIEQSGDLEFVQFVGD